MNEKNLVKIRKEKNYYLPFFIEARRIIITNEVGAKVIDLIFNKNYSISKTAKKLFPLNNKINKNLFQKKIKHFLIDVKKELKKYYQGGFPFVEDEQMDVPIAAEIQINTTCNLRCKHCCQSNYNKMMPFKKIKKILEILYKEKVFEINLVGGEVFLHPDILKIIYLSCDKYNFATNIITNGTLLTDKLIKKISKFRNKPVFLISLEGVGIHNDEIRGKGTFEKIDKAIRTLKKYKIYLEVSTTINAVNIKHWKEIVDYCKKLDMPCNFNLFKIFKPEQKKLVLKPGNYFEFVKKIFELRKKKKVDIGLTNAAIVSELNGGESRNECKATLSGLTINVQGEMVPCPFLDEVGYYKNKKLPIFNENFKETWENNFWFKDFRKGSFKECQACSYIFSGSRHKRNPYGLNAFKNYWNKRRKIK